MKNIRLGEVLVDSGYLTNEQVEQALQVQKASGGKKLGAILLDLGIITEEQLVDALQRRLGVPVLNLRDTPIPLSVIRMVPEAFARQNTLIPVRMQGDNVVVALFDPLNYYAIDDFERLTGHTMIPNLATRADIENAIDKYYASSNAHEVAADATDAFDEAVDLTGVDWSDAELRASSAPVVRLVNTLIEQAVKRRASDIHIEPGAAAVRVRFRVDGDLTEIMQLKNNLLAPVVTRIKLEAGLNIAEKRIPQDGRMTHTVAGVTVNIRVSTIATVYGEKAVLRLLNDSSDRIMTIPELGMNPYNEKLLRELLRSPNGIILVTGPTGSGKSTTLYAVLQELNKPNLNIVSVEDPVEKILSGINQTQVNPKAGLTFAAGLRSFLRQDPDIMMVGEIRDTETAEIAASAAITGHLVLSSLHTNDAAGAYMRFMDMGIAPYVVSSSIVGILAQRLVKRICPHCRESYEASPEELATLNHLGIHDLTTLYRGNGCAKCNYAGYYGRTAIYEIISTDATIRQMVTDRAKSQQIRDYLLTQGFRDMRSNAVELMRNGQITLREMVSKTYSVENA